MTRSVANYNIFVSSVPCCGNDYGQNEISAEQKCGVPVSRTERI